MAENFSVLSCWSRYANTIEQLSLRVCRDHITAAYAILAMNYPLLALTPLSSQPSWNFSSFQFVPLTPFISLTLSFKYFLYFIPSFFIIWLVSFEMSWKGSWFFGSFCGSQRKKKSYKDFYAHLQMSGNYRQFHLKKESFSFPFYPFKIKKKEKRNSFLLPAPVQTSY